MCFSLINQISYQKVIIMVIIKMNLKGECHFTMAKIHFLSLKDLLPIFILIFIHFFNPRRNHHLISFFNLHP